MDRSQEQALQLENLKGAIQYGIEGLKALILVNGGAAIAVMSFYGNALREKTDVGVDKHALAASLNGFGAGVFFAVLAFIFAYLSQLISATRVPPAIARLEFQARMLAIVLSIVAAFLFIRGSGYAARAFFLPLK